MLRIVYLTVADISGKNGQGIYALKVLESFAARENVDISVICPKPRNCSELRNIHQKYKFDLIHLAQKKKDRNVIWHFLVQIQLIYVLARMGRKDALVYSLKPMMFAPILYSRIFGVPIYLLVEGLGEKSIYIITKGLLVKIGTYLLHLNIKCASKVYPAYISAKQWADRIRQKKDSTLIYCGVDKKVFSPLPKQKTEKLTIGFVGSFRKIHLLHQLFKAVQCLDIRLLLVGDGAEKSGLEQLFNSEKFKSGIIFLGKMEQKALPKFYSKCDVMWAAVDTNHWGIPIKCFEYLACNKKVIYTYKEDFKFIADNKFGFLLKRNEPDEIRSLVLTLKQKFEKGLLKGNTGSRAYVLKRMSWDMFPEIILDDILEAVK